MISARQRERVAVFVDRAREKKYIEGVSGNGFFYQPMPLAGAGQDDEIVKQPFIRRKNVRCFTLEIGSRLIIIQLEGQLANDQIYLIFCCNLVIFEQLTIDIFDP